MKKRQEEIVFRLTNAESPATSALLAKQLGVSVRTVKYEIEELKTELVKHGANIISKRNVGYTIDVSDPVLYAPFIETVNIKQYFGRESGRDESALQLNLMRRLVAASRHILQDDLEEEMFVSRSTLQQLMKKATIFLENHHLRVEAKPGAGVMVIGNEIHLRLAMVEMYSYHFHKASIEDADEEYIKWVNCNKQERQDIRHTFLKELRESEVSVLDLLSQRMSLYLVIARNRWRAGYGVVVHSKQKKQIRACDVYPVAVCIFERLVEKFIDFDVVEDEIDMFAIYLLCYRDMGHLSLRKARAPFLFAECQRLSGVIFQELYARHGLEFNRFAWAETELQNHLIPIMAKKHFKMDKEMYFEVQQDKRIYDSPLSIEFARTIILCVENELGTTLAQQDKVKLAYYVYEIIAYTDYEIRRLDLLLVSFMGISFAKVLELRLARRYPWLIRSCTCVELYEIRGLDQTNYDAIILDTNNFACNYELPADTLHVITRPQELNRVFDSVMIGAYQYKKHLPNPALITVHTDFDYLNEEQFFQFISYRHGKTLDYCKDMQCQMGKQEELFALRPVSGTAILFGPLEMTNGQAVELYHLRKPGIWNGDKIENILYLCLEYGNDLQRIKILENCLRMMAVSPENVEALEKNPSSAFEKAMHDYLSQR